MQKSSGLKSVFFFTFILVIVAVFLSSFVLGVAFDGNIGSSGSGYSGGLRVLTTPDIHSHLFPMNDNDTGTRIGRIAALADTLGEENDDTLYLFAGDLGEGGFYNMYSGVPEAKAYSMAGIDATVLGNHAFDFPVSVLNQWVTNASYPILCANMDFTDTELNGSIKDYVILDVAGAKVGVFGIITPQLGKVTEIPDGVILYENISSIAESVIDDLEEQGVDVIIALTHQYGDEDIELAESVAGIDLIIGGHDHLVWNETVIAPDGNKTLIVHAGKYGEETDSVDLTFSNGKIAGTSIGRYEITEELPDDQEITSFVMPYYVNYTAGLSGPIGETLVPLDATENIKAGEMNIGDLVADIMRKDVPGVDIAFINSGSFRGDCIVPAGNISYLTLETLLPFEDIVIKIRMTGQEIKDTLERSASALVAAGDESDSESRVPSGGFLQLSGVRFDLNMSGEPFSADFDTGTVLYAGNRIENLTVVTESGMVPVDPAAFYVVAVNDYIADGGDGYSNLEAIPGDMKTNTGIYLVNLLATDIEENSPISPGTDGRIRILR
ncbi:5'-Nucleotidase domain protein [Methanolacinia petrolearia DSM 11571]|uniref:5'-Nucleotidase domain protein n=1 Tax=Methanolacinia petrolearia (strain DSM 11571 / OCM 486 / SEBR 4847) TaxID=679926 RepID=E1RKG8_METP4|nr:bifunctional UDP-sugar hydrolase/5'-nucleotidase [Methanolacinia petrolearia]ADN35821.1 5'-Nucleotidase domain protein [Methanolacinia petrolearia DSM 11571]